MMRKLRFLPLLLTGTVCMAQTGNHVFSGAEMTTFGTGDLATPGGQTWSTDRSATPGYFSASGPDGLYASPADASFALVDGYVKFYASAANQSFTFPVGVNSALPEQGDLRSLTVAGTLPADAILATAWIIGDPGGNLDPTGTGAAAGAHSVSSVGAGIISVSTAGQWDWQDFNSNAAGSTVTVSLPNMSNFATAANLRLVGWDGASWIDLSATQGNAAASGNTENSTLTGTMQNNITAIGIGSITTPLPVTLIDFTAERQQGNKVMLRWTVAAEKDFDRYEVEYAADAVRFRNIGQVPGGHSDGNYSLPYEQPDKTGFYRLRMVDRDGPFSYSKVVRVDLDAVADAWSVYPNPVIHTAIIRGTRSGDRLRLCTADGRLLQTAGATAASATVSLEGYAGGLYWLQVWRDGHPVYQVKLLKK